MRYIIFLIGALMLSTSAWAVQGGSGGQGSGCLPEQKLVYEHLPNVVRGRLDKYRKDGWYVKQVAYADKKNGYLLLERPCK